MQVLPIRRLPTSQLQGTPTTFKERKLNFEIKITDTEFQIEHLNNSQFNSFPLVLSPLYQSLMLPLIFLRFRRYFQRA